MRKITQKFLTFVWNNLGHCFKCIRLSLGAAIMSWAIFLVFKTLDKEGIAAFVSIVAGLITCLWVAHLTSFSVKTLRNNMVQSPSKEVAALARRRAALRVIGNAMLFGVLASTVGISPAFACAPGMCECGTDHRCVSNPGQLSCYCVCNAGGCKAGKPIDMKAYRKWVAQSKANQRSPK